MLFEFHIENDFESKKELLSLFYPNLISSQNRTLSNEKNALIKMQKKNVNLSQLIKKLDLYET